MRLPVIQGVIRRRILANFRVEPEVMQQQLPTRFRPKLQQGFAVAGICLIRLYPQITQISQIKVGSCVKGCREPFC